MIEMRGLTLNRTVKEMQKLMKSQKIDFPIYIMGSVAEEGSSTHDLDIFTPSYESMSGPSLKLQRFALFGQMLGHKLKFPVHLVTYRTLKLKPPQQLIVYDKVFIRVRKNSTQRITSGRI